MGEIGRRFHMSIKTLKLSTDKKDSSHNPVTKKREKLWNGIHKQLCLLDERINGIRIEGKKPIQWYWLGDDGDYRCSIFYGRKPIEIQKGKFSFVAKDIDEIQQTLGMIMDEVKKGYFDNKIEIISKSMRKNFNR